MSTLGLGDALRTMTRFPLSAKALEKQERMLFWFPFVGALLGAFSVGASLLPLDNRIRSSLVIALGAYLTRGFHLDGLCDFADGLGGGWTKERALTIMKDSHSGAFAIITLFCTLLMQYSALCTLVDIPLSLLLMPAIGRLMQVYGASLMPYARAGEGTAAVLVRAAKPRHVVLPTVQLLIVLVWLFVSDSPYAMPALSAFLCAWICMFMLLLVSKRRLKGVTGDVLGAIEVLCETFAMIGFLLPLA